MALTAPPDPQEGEPILPWARSIGALLRQIIPRESADIWPEIATTGTRWNLRRRRKESAGGGGAASHALHCSDDSEEGTPRIAITYGTIGGVDLPSYLVEVGEGEGRYLYAALTVDDALPAITGITLGDETTVPADTATTIHVTLCRYSAAVTDGVASVDLTSAGLGDNLSGSVAAQWCRNYAWHPDSDEPQWMVTLHAL